MNKEDVTEMYFYSLRTFAFIIINDFVLQVSRDAFVKF